MIINNKPKFFAFLAIIVIVVIIGLSAATAGPNKPKINTSPTPPPTETQDPTEMRVVITRGVGIEEVTFTNLNKMETNYKSLIDLPYTIKCSPGDIIRFSVTAQPGFEWKNWELSIDPHWISHNPTTIVIDESFTMTPTFRALDFGSNETAIG